MQSQISLNPESTESQGLAETWKCVDPSSHSIQKTIALMPHFISCCLNVLGRGKLIPLGPKVKTCNFTKNKAKTWILLAAWWSWVENSNCYKCLLKTFSKLSFVFTFCSYYTKYSSFLHRTVSNGWWSTAWNRAVWENRALVAPRGKAMPAKAISKSASKNGLFFTWTVHQSVKL